MPLALPVCCAQAALPLHVSCAGDEHAPAAQAGPGGAHWSGCGDVQLYKAPALQLRCFSRHGLSWALGDWPLCAGSSRINLNEPDRPSRTTSLTSESMEKEQFSFVARVRSLQEHRASSLVRNRTSGPHFRDVKTVHLPADEHADRSARPLGPFAACKKVACITPRPLCSRGAMAAIDEVEHVEVNGAGWAPLPA